MKDRQTVNITSEAFDIIAANARGTFRPEGSRRGDGTWDVPLGADTVRAARGAPSPGRKHQRLHCTRAFHRWSRRKLISTERDYA